MLIYYTGCLNTCNIFLLRIALNWTIRLADRWLDLCASYSHWGASVLILWGHRCFFFFNVSPKPGFNFAQRYLYSCRVNYGRSACSLWQILGLTLHCCLRPWCFSFGDLCVGVSLSPQCQGCCLQSSAAIHCRGLCGKRAQKACPDQFRSVWHN